MKRLGLYLVIFGVGSMILSFMNMEFVILAWIDHWGPTVGWGIRIAMAVVGLILMLAAGSNKAVATAPARQTEPSGSAD